MPRFIKPGSFILCVLVLCCSKHDQTPAVSTQACPSPGQHLCPDGHCYRSQGCPPPYQPPPGVATLLVYGVNAQSASCKSDYTCGIQTGCSATERGVCWSTGSLTPTIKDRKTSDGAGSGVFLSNITGLGADSTYYARAYAINSSGVVYGKTITFRTFTTGLTTDISGNEYHHVIIGTQVWMVENLKATKYNEGTDISGYNWYDNDETYKNPYGALYSWETISSGKLCPLGWHVPSLGEFDKLIAYYDPYNTQSLLSETGFAPLAGGFWQDGMSVDPIFRWPAGFSYLGRYTCYGSNSEWPSCVVNFGCDGYFATLFLVSGTNTNATTGAWKKSKVSVRCIRNDSF